MAGFYGFWTLRKVVVVYVLFAIYWCGFVERDVAALVFSVLFGLLAFTSSEGA